MTHQSQIGRLAMREEGQNWVAYWADTGTMEGAVFLGAIRMAFVAHNKKRKQGFIDLMTACAADVIEDITGTRPDWNKPQSAPESEKSGNA